MAKAGSSRCSRCCCSRSAAPLIGAPLAAHLAGLFGAALLYGDGIITPAISVLGAVEGLEVVTPHLRIVHRRAVVVILWRSLFFVQRFGTARVGTAFGPIMAVWFGAIAVLGRGDRARAAHSSRSIRWHGVQFFVDNGRIGFLVWAPWSSP